jgi:hypothetical protein
MLPSVSSASIGTVTMNGSVAPVPVAGSTLSPVSLSFGFDAAYSGGFNPVPSGVVFHFDNHIAFDTTGLAQCDPSSITGEVTSKALFACGAARVGSGSAAYNNGAINGVITAFNGTPSAGHDRVLFHIDINNGSIILVLIGDFGPSSRGGDYGTQINAPSWPNTPGVVPTHWAVTFDNLTPVPGHHYVSAGCDTDGILHFASDFSYYDLTAQSATATQACVRTGRRATALRKCKRKDSKARRKKCRKKANRLPV